MNMAAALPSSPRKCASSPSAVRPQRLKSPASPAKRLGRHPGRRDADTYGAGHPQDRRTCLGNLGRLREQDIGSSQINEAIQQLDKVTQQNAGASEEMSATSEELAAQAEELQASIAFFKVDGAGKQSAQQARQLQSVAKKMATEAPAKRSAATNRPQPKSHGFALDMSLGGPDGDDDDFRQTA